MKTLKHLYNVLTCSQSPNRRTPATSRQQSNRPTTSVVLQATMLRSPSQLGTSPDLVDLGSQVDPVAQKPFTILSLDGGEIGTTEFTQLLILKEILHRIESQGKPLLSQYFDFIGGTGMGGVIAILVARLNVPIDQVIEFYQAIHQALLSKKHWKKPDRNLESNAVALRELIYSSFPKETLNASIIAQVIDRQPLCVGFTCAVNPQNLAHPRLFTTYSAKHVPVACSVGQAIEMSLADSFHLPSFKLGDDYLTEEFLGSSHRFSNPISSCLQEVEALYGPSHQIACILSVGSGNCGVIDSEMVRRIIADCEKDADDWRRRCSGIDGVFHRLDVKRGLEVISTDLGSIKTHTNQYLLDPMVSSQLNSLVSILCSRPATVEIGQLTLTIPMSERLFGGNFKDDLKLIRKAELWNELKPISRAIYDHADAPVPRGPCTENTRVEILAEIIKWANNLDDRTIYCLNGMVGTGKTTIAYSFSQLLKSKGRLGASFFCSRADEACRNGTKILPSISYQIAGRVPGFGEELLKVLQDPDVERSFQNLVVNPFEATGPGLQPPLIVVIDALDECSLDQHIEKLLTELLTICSSSPIKFFVTFRPDYPLQGYIQGYNDVLHKFHLHNVEESLVERDIRSFLKEKFLSLVGRRKRDNKIVIHDWPPQQEFDSLVNLAGKLFIFASTAYEYIDAKGSADIRERLRWIVNVDHQPSLNQTRTLDDLYYRIVHQSFLGLEHPEEEKLSNILRVIITARTPLRCEDISSLLQIDRDTMLSMLTELHSVIYIHPNDGPISTFHASFPDFLTTKPRSQEYYLCIQQSHDLMGSHCLDLLFSSLHENMCSMEGRPENSTIPQGIIDSNISHAVTYACQHWGMHCVDAESYSNSTELHNSITTFFSEHVLHWIECLSFQGGLYDAIRVLRYLEIWASKSSERHLANLTKEIRKFISQSIDLLSINALETYCSALVWLPISSLLRLLLAPNSRKLPRVIKGLPQNWDTIDIIFTGHLSSINSVAFSPNGHRIVSSSDDETVRVWDVVTGEEVQKLTGHASRGIAFSLDGERIVSDSDDGTVKVWDVATGEEVLTGHSDSLRSAGSSPDGQRTVFGSADGTVHVFDMELGELHKLSGHSGMVLSAAFSPDGQRIVSASFDGTVRVWDVETRKEMQRFSGHSIYRISSIAYSSDGQKIVLGSGDGTIQVWDLGTREDVPAQKLTEHHDSHGISLLVFSPNGQRVVSGSSSGILQVWDVGTGEEMQKLTGHSNKVVSVAFSPDGQRIVSSFGGGTVGVWDVVTGEEVQKLTGHSGKVGLIAFSPNGQRIVSASTDKTVRVWDVGTGEEVHKLIAHDNWVDSATFSPTGQNILLGSKDGNVHVWSVGAGKELEIEQLSADSDQVGPAAYSPDGQRIVFGSHDGYQQVWDVRPGEEQQQPELDPSLLAKFLQATNFISDPRWLVDPTGSYLPCWIPPAHRYHRCAEFHDNHVALGYVTGNVVMLELR